MRAEECFSSSELPLTTQHAHANCEIRFIQSGSINLTVNGETYTLRKGDIILIPANIPHTVFTDVQFSAIMTYASNLSVDYPIFAHDYDGTIQMLLKILLKLMTEQEEGYNILSDIIADAIYNFLLKYQSVKSRRDFTIRFKNLLYENIPNSDFNITNEILNMGYNVDYFRRCFKKDFGQTPHDYLINIRIDNVCKLLRNSETAKIENIAALSGFNDSFYLSKIFKQKTGLTPRDYRKLYKRV